MEEAAEVSREDTDVQARVRSNEINGLYRFRFHGNQELVPSREARGKFYGSETKHAGAADPPNPPFQTTFMQSQEE